MNALLWSCRNWVFLLVATLSLLSPCVASATVQKEGSWPEADRKVSLEFEGKPSEGLSKLASEAEWSLVVSKGIEMNQHDVKIDVDDQPADIVLEALFAESNVVARRNGRLITITPAPSGAPTTTTPNATATDAGPAAATPATTVPAPPAIPPPPPVPTVRGEDRNVFGSSLVVGKDEIVHTVTVTGGAAKIRGTVTGDLVIAGGSAKIEEGGRVVGNATIFGGSLKVERGARIDGDIGVVGGALKREESAIIGGKVVDDNGGQHGKTNVNIKNGKVTTSVEADDAPEEPKRSRLSEALHSFGQSVTNMALLFVLGCVLLALATRRMETLRVEAVARPMRSFALGIVGSIGGLIVLVVLCVTVLGIPFAILATLVAVFALYSSIAAVLTGFGALVAGHKTENPYVHLLVGCIAFLVVGAIPFVGGFVTLVLTMIAIGALVSTRLAGFVKQRTQRSGLV